MKKINLTTYLSALVILAYLLSACSGVPASAIQNVNSNDLTEISTAISGADDNANLNANSANENESNANDNSVNANENQNENNNGNDNGAANVNSNDNTNSQELVGMVTDITDTTITIDGVVYNIADFTEFKDKVAVGDQVKVHVILNADGTITIREIEKSDQAGIEDNNSNSNGSGSDDNSNSNVNSNTNGDDHGNDNGGNSGSGGSGNDNGSGKNDNGGSGNDNGSGKNDNGGGNGNGDG